MEADSGGVTVKSKMAATVENGHAVSYGTAKTMDNDSSDNTSAGPAITTESERLVDKANERDLSNPRAFFHLFRIMTGPSILGTGKIMENGGILLGPLGFITIGYLNAWCNVTMVNCSQTLCKRLGRTSVTYEDVVEESALLYVERPRFAKASVVLRHMATAALVLCQLGLLSFYIKVIGTTLQKELESAFPSWPLELIVTELIVCLLLIPYSWVRNLRVLSWFSLFGNFILVVCVVTVLQYMCRNLKDASHLPLVTDNFWTIPLFVGASVFTVEGIPMVIPIENKMIHPEDYGGFCGLISLSATLNICVNVAIGFFSYLAVGDGITGNVLVHLPSTWVYSLVNVAVALLVFLTYALQLYMPAEGLNSILRSRVKNSFVQNYGSLITRTAIVILSYLITAVVPKVDLLMSLVGAFTGTILVFLFPPFCELMIVYKTKGRLPWNVLIKDVLLLTFGTVFFVTGTYTSLKDIIEAL